MAPLYTIIAIVVTVLFVAFFAGIEVAFNNANRLNIELKKKQGKTSGIILAKFIENPARFLSACLIGVNLFIVLYGLMFSEFMNSLFWKRYHIENSYIKLIVDTLIPWAIILVFGIFLPKAYFRAKSDGLLSLFARPANFFYNLFENVAGAGINLSENILKYLFNVKTKDKSEPFSRADAEQYIQQTRDVATENQDLNTELFENALQVPAIKIRQCLVPRTEIEAVSIHTSIEDTIKKFTETKLSKIVVFDEYIDNIQGYIHQLDMFKQPPNIASILLPIPVVPESMSATDLINKFTKERKSIAWVVDEFGGTAGIITMEDVLEEIFGEIKDEYDTEEFEEKKLSDTEYIFSGRLELDYLKEKYQLDFPENDSETLSGYIINQYEAIPKQKDRIIIDKYEFDILNVSDTRIEMVKLKLLR
jgi:CBS domain containing-hemolysin-like protein